MIYIHSTYTYSIYDSYHSYSWIVEWVASGQDRSSKARVPSRVHRALSMRQPPMNQWCFSPKTCAPIILIHVWEHLKNLWEHLKGIKRTALIFRFGFEHGPSHPVMVRLKAILWRARPDPSRRASQAEVGHWNLQNLVPHTLEGNERTLSEETYQREKWLSKATSFWIWHGSKSGQREWA